MQLCNGDMSCSQYFRMKVMNMGRTKDYIKRTRLNYKICDNYVHCFDSSSLGIYLAVFNLQGTLRAHNTFSSLIPL